jgi:hypothetical protein
LRLFVKGKCSPPLGGSRARHPPCPRPATRPYLDRKKKSERTGPTHVHRYHPFPVLCRGGSQPSIAAVPGSRRRPMLPMAPVLPAGGCAPHGPAGSPMSPSLLCPATALPGRGSTLAAGFRRCRRGSARPLVGARGARRKEKVLTVLVGRSRGWRCRRYSKVARLQGSRDMLRSLVGEPHRSFFFTMLQ